MGNSALLTESPKSHTLRALVPSIVPSYRPHPACTAVSSYSPTLAHSLGDDFGWMNGQPDMGHLETNQATQTRKPKRVALHHAIL